MPYETYSTRQMQRLMGDIVDELPIENGGIPSYQEQYNPRIHHTNTINAYEPQQQQHHHHQQQHAYEQQQQYYRHGHYRQYRRHRHHYRHQHQDRLQYQEPDVIQQQASFQFPPQQIQIPIQQQQEPQDYHPPPPPPPQDYHHPHHNHDNYHQQQQRFGTTTTRVSTVVPSGERQQTYHQTIPQPPPPPPPQRISFAVTGTGIVNTTTNHNNNNHHHNNYNNNTNSPRRTVSVVRPPDLHSHPARCPPVNLEFLWKLYHQRINLEQLQATREERIQTLKGQGFPTGLATLILDHAIHHPIRIWLIDNCGTMHKNDGHLVSQCAKGKVHVIHCTRWEEITSTVQWHAEMAAWQQTPMAIRLLQDPGTQVGPQQLGISASKHYSSSEEVARMKVLLKKTRPIGATSPINLHLQELFPSIQSMVPVLNRTQTHITLCICTDSIPTDADGNEHPDMIQELYATLQQLSDWPVQIVWRLSTDEERVVQFYRNLRLATNTSNHHNNGNDYNNNNNNDDDDDDETFREKLMVLDDYVSECQHVQEMNPWFHYGYPLHLCREEGIRIPILDALSERPIQDPSELCELMQLVFGQAIRLDEDDYSKFRKQLDLLNKETGVLWNPIKKKFVLWMDLKKLDRQMEKAKRESSSGGCGSGGNSSDRGSRGSGTLRWFWK